MSTPTFQELLARASAVFDSLTPDQQSHHRHEQRISFVYGNIALSQRDVDEASLRASVREAAGPCPCAPCRAAAWQPVVGCWCTILDGNDQGRIAQVVCFDPADDCLPWQVRVERGVHDLRTTGSIMEISARRAGTVRREHHRYTAPCGRDRARRVNDARALA